MASVASPRALMSLVSDRLLPALPLGLDRHAGAGLGWAGRCLGAPYFWLSLFTSGSPGPTRVNAMPLGPCLMKK